MNSLVRSILTVLTVLVVCLPISFVITVILYPIWLWIETRFDIEATGHSGPSEWCYWIVYAICVTLAMVSYFQFEIIKIIPGLAVFLGFIFVVLFFLPLPHGGSIGMGLLHEITDVIEDIPKKKIEAKNRKAEFISKRDRLYQKLSDRFAGELEFKKDFYMDHWQTGTVLGSQAWLDTNTGIIWGSDKQIVSAGWGREGLQFARNYCQNLAPKGYWSLPTNAEFALGIKSKMQNYIDNLAGKWIAQMYNSSFLGLDSMPSLVGFSNQGIKEITVRCVGRTDIAPLHGYIRDDISNADVMGMLNR